MEIWKDVIGFEGIYEVSSMGSIKSKERKVPYGNIGILIIYEKILKPKLTKDGYFSVNLRKPKISKHCRIHRIVAEAFCTNLENKPLINHINGNKLDNRAENLEWCTPSENIKHSFNIGTSKPSNTIKILDTSTNIVYNSITDAANQKNIGKSNLSFMLSGYKGRKNKTTLIYA